MWDAIVNHPFVDALAAGTINDEAMRAYLVQDHRFLDHFVVLLASMVAAAPTLKVLKHIFTQHAYKAKVNFSPFRSNRLVAFILLSNRVFCCKLDKKGRIDCRDAASWLWLLGRRIPTSNDRSLDWG